MTVADGEGCGVVSARRARGGDLHDVAALFSRAVAEMGSLRGGPELLSGLSDVAGVNIGVHAGRWKVVTEALSRPDPPFWIAERGGAPIGFAWVRVAHHSDFGPNLGVVDFVYVDPDERGTGAGVAIMDEVQAWFSHQGCKAVDANALPGDRETKNFFEEAGFKARLLVMHRPIAPAGS